jgi:hypothetical protein
MGQISEFLNFLHQESTQTTIKCCQDFLVLTRHFVRPRILVKLASYKLSLFACCLP